jgi:hypothetical protein
VKLRGQHSEDSWILTLFLSKASPGASHQYFLDFCFQSLFMVQFDCALNLQDLYGTIAALRFPSGYPWLPLL